MCSRAQLNYSKYIFLYVEAFFCLFFMFLLVFLHSSVGFLEFIIIFFFFSFHLLSTVADAHVALSCQSSSEINTFLIVVVLRYAYNLKPVVS